VAQIPSNTERQNFISSLDFSTQTHSDDLSRHHSMSSSVSETVFSTDYIDQLTSDLTRYVGPVAKHLIKATLKKVSSKQQLCLCLADKIPNAQERATFLKNQDYSD